MESFNLILAQNIEQAIDWEKAVVSEDYYHSIIIDHLEKLGATPGIKSCLHDIEWEGHTFSYEEKKALKGERFHFSDTFLKDDMYYILIYVAHQKIRIEKGSNLIELALKESGSTTHTHLEKIGKLVLDMLGEGGISGIKLLDVFGESVGLLKAGVLNNHLSYYDFGQAFKNVISFGDFSSRPRPNWTLKLYNSKISANTILHPTENEEDSWEIPDKVN